MAGFALFSVPKSGCFKPFNFDRYWPLLTDR
jgi:hypothetical protein